MSKHFVTFEAGSQPINPEMEQSATKALFVQIVDVLTAKGRQPIEPPEEWDEYGWYADFQRGSANLTCMMQRSDEWLVIITANRSFMDRLKGRHHEAELSDFSNLFVTAVKEVLGVDATLYKSEEEFMAGPS